VTGAQLPPRKVDVITSTRTVHRYPRIDEVRRIDLPHHDRDDGRLVVIEQGVQVPFDIQRVFTIVAPPGAKRGDHAHRRCAQLLLCVRGAVDIDCNDAREHRIFTLDEEIQALLVPPMIWHTVNFRKVDSAIIVLCDRHYESDDYIRDYAEFASIHNAQENQEDQENQG